MTIASRLLFVRRPRAGRSSDAEVIPGELDYGDRDAHRARSWRHRCRDGQVERDVTRPRSTTAAPAAHAARLVCHRLPPHTDNISESGIDDHTNPHIIDPGACRLSLAGSERLPAAVLQARARLLQRLRCVSPATSRQRIPAARIFPNEQANSETFNHINPTQHEALTNWSEAGGNLLNLDYDERVRISKPSGLSWEAFCNLQQEVFVNEDGPNQNSGAILECCICLEKFLQGDKLIKLHCEHRFHPLCLQPWVRICAYCPYCRARLIY